MSKLCKPPFRKFKHSIQPMMKHKSFLSVKMFPKFLINSVCDSELRFKLIAIYNWLSQMKFYRTNWWDFRNHKTETFKAAVLYTIPLAPNQVKKMKTCYFFLDMWIKHLILTTCRIYLLSIHYENSRERKTGTF